jgi:hypothetical protein
MPANNLNVKDLPAVNISFKKTKVTEAYGGVPDEIEEFKMLPFLMDQGASFVWDEKVVIYDVNDQSMRHSLNRPYWFFYCQVAGR